MVLTSPKNQPLSQDCKKVRLWVWLHIEMAQCLFGACNNYTAAGIATVGFLLGCGPRAEKGGRSQIPAQDGRARAVRSTQNNTKPLVCTLPVSVIQRAAG